MDYGERLRYFVESSTWSKKDLAEEIGVSKAAFHDWLRKPYPRLDAIERVCELLGISLGEFFDEEGAYKLLRILKEVVK